MKKKLVGTGGTGRFGNCLKSIKTNHTIFFPTKKTFDIFEELYLKYELKMHERGEI